MTPDQGALNPDAPLSVEDVIDSTPISSGQWLIIGICGLISMIDAFDVQAIAFAAPEIRREWGVSAASFGPIFSIGLFGGMIGGFGIGPLVDRLGARRILVLCTILFGTTTLATVLATDMFTLGLLRGVAGLGLGGAIPAMVAILAAYSPKRHRATLVTGAFCIQLLGAVIGSLASAWLMQIFGWQAVFWLGGLVPLILLPLIILFVPEPPGFIAAQSGDPGKLDRLLQRIGKSEFQGRITASGSRASEASNSALALFREGRFTGTFLLMMISLVGGTYFYFLANWLPTILRDAGHSLQNATFGSTALNLGGLLGSLAVARMVDRYGPYGIMSAGYLLGALFIFAVAMVTLPIGPILILVFLCAFFGLGAQYCIPAATVLLYPAHLQGAGIGFVLGFARMGAVIGPLVGSYILLVGGGPRELFQFSAVCALGASLTVVLAQRAEKARNRRAQAPS